MIVVGAYHPELDEYPMIGFDPDTGEALGIFFARPIASIGIIENLLLPPEPPAIASSNRRG